MAPHAFSPEIGLKSYLSRSSFPGISPMFRSIDSSVSFNSLEQDILSRWEKDDAFRQSVAKPAGKSVAQGDAKTFAFFDGPPFATGLPHYGHLLAGTIKDIVPRYWTMRGYTVERRFGWDCHGLPIENLIQDQLKLHSVRDIATHGIDKFNEACRAGVLKYTAEWRKTVTRMGRWVDFDNDYKTMDLSFMETVWWVFKQCYDKGLIDQGWRIQPYSPALATPLSNFEVNQGYKDRQDPSLTVIFPLEPAHGGSGVGAKAAHSGEAATTAGSSAHTGDENLLVWTTTPWTLPSNLAVALKADLEYSLVEHQGKKYWVAESRRLAYFGEGDAVVKTAKGADLAGRRYKPLFEFAPYMSDKQYTLLLAEFVSDSDGTGAVHIAPSFGEEDFQLGSQEGLGLWDPLDAEGKFTDLVPDWAGMGAKDADKSIIQRLKGEGRIFKHDTLVHSYPHCWRTDVPLLYRALKAWYLRLDREVTSAEGVTKTLKQWMIDCNQQINWVPDHIRDGRFGKWLDGARDWNLSRNRFWGTCIPVWLAEDGEGMLCVGSREELERLSGVKVDDLHKHVIDPIVIRTSDGKTFDPKGKAYRRTPEVLDCWFESGSMPYAQVHYPFENRESFEPNFPADFIAEGLDQTRGWFYTLTVLGAALFQKPAMKNVIVNGIILAEDGQKMSKRLRNYPDPNDLIDRTGADAIRLFMCDSAAVKAEDLKFSEAGVKNIIRSVLLPLWNSACLFVTYANADAGKGQLTWRPGQKLKSPHELDRWILSDMQGLLLQVRREMDAYRLYNVVPAVVGFVDDLTNWYIRRSRRRFWKSEDDADKNFAYATLYGVLTTFARVMAPFLPFLAEELWQVLVREPQDQGNLAVTGVGATQPVSVHLAEFPEFDAALYDEALNARMHRVRQAVTLGRGLRSAHNLKNRQPLRRLIVVARNEAQRAEMLQNEELVRDELNVKHLEVTLDESTLVTYRAKANFKALGARLGKNMKAFADKIAVLPHADVAKLVGGGSLELDGISLTAADILVQRDVMAGLVVDASSDVTVALDTHVDEGLMLEMLAREIVNRIQNSRKEQDLSVTDRIHVTLGTASELLRQAAEAHRAYIVSEVLAAELKLVAETGLGGIAVEIGEEVASLDVIKL
jgi:isoleucyl-tRNA synthetase